MAHNIAATIEPAVTSIATKVIQSKPKGAIECLHVRFGNYTGKRKIVKRNCTTEYTEKIL